MTYGEVWDNEILTIEAKAIYGFLCTYAGSGTECYPSVDLVCEKLKISRSRFYKHMNLLIGCGFVEKRFNYVNGFRTNNVYVLIPNSLKGENLQLENLTVENLTVENLTKENLTTNINSTNNNSINNNNNNIVCPELDKPAQDLSGIRLPLNDKSFYDVPLDKIALWKETYPGVNVEQELKRMIAWLDSNPTRRKTKRGITKFINGWLSREQDRGGTYKNSEDDHKAAVEKLLARHRSNIEPPECEDGPFQ